MSGKYTYCNGDGITLSGCGRKTKYSVTPISIVCRKYLGIGIIKQKW
jgi:hypothetical protein